MTFSIKCFITFCPRQQSPSEQQLQEMLTHRQELIEHLKQCIKDVHNSCIPSAQHPIAYLDCPFDHQPDTSPHIPLDEVSVAEDVLCRLNQNRPIPKDAYILLVKASICDGNTSNDTHESMIDALYELNPELNDYIDMNSLIPYMNKYRILTKDERFYLNDSSKPPSEKVTYLLSCLERKDYKTVYNFIQALKEEKEHSGHVKLCSLLEQKGVKL